MPNQTMKKVGPSVLENDFFTSLERQWNRKLRNGSILINPVCITSACLCITLLLYTLNVIWSKKNRANFATGDIFDDHLWVCILCNFFRTNAITSDKPNPLFKAF